MNATILGYIPVALAIVFAVCSSDEVFEIRDPNTAYNSSLIPENTTTLTYYNISIPNISLVLDFTHLAQLTNLTFQYTQTETIDPGAFENLPNLTILQLRYIGLHELQAGVFTGLDSITNIDLRGNALDENVLDSEIWKDVNETLTDLILDLNNISNLTRDIFINLRNLISLRLFKNRISDIASGTFNGLSSLQFLHLGQNQILSLYQDNFQGLSSLTELLIWGNDFTTLQNGTFRRLGSLEFLSAGPNVIQTIQPRAFQGLKSLRTLSLIGSVSLQTLEWNSFDPADFYPISKFIYFTCRNSTVKEI